SVFSKNRERLLEGDIAAKLLSAVLAHPRVKRLLSTDHFSVDGTLIESWASMKSFKPKDGSDEPPADGDGRNREADFHGEKRSNDTHRLYRKGPGKEAKLCFMGHALMENRNGLVVEACLTPADGHAERVAALHMIEPHADRPQAITLGADKAYDAEDFVNELRSMKVTPHVAQNTSGRSSAIDGRTITRTGRLMRAAPLLLGIRKCSCKIRQVVPRGSSLTRSRPRIVKKYRGTERRYAFYCQAHALCSGSRQETSNVNVAIAVHVRPDNRRIIAIRLSHD